MDRNAKDYELIATALSFVFKGVRFFIASYSLGIAANLLLILSISSSRFLGSLTPTLVYTSKILCFASTAIGFVASWKSFHGAEELSSLGKLFSVASALFAYGFGGGYLTLLCFHLGETIAFLWSTASEGSQIGIKIDEYLSTTAILLLPAALLLAGFIGLALLCIALYRFERRYAYILSSTLIALAYPVSYAELKTVGISVVSQIMLLAMWVSLYRALKTYANR